VTTASDLLADLHAADVEVTLTETGLRYRAPDRPESAQLLVRLRENKHEVRQLLAGLDAAKAEGLAVVAEIESAGASPGRKSAATAYRSAVERMASRRDPYLMTCTADLRQVLARWRQTSS
jgi:hypothetical protein